MIRNHTLEYPMMDHKRKVQVILPKNYDKSKKYPVLYMHDGQNLIEPSPHSGESWDILNQPLKDKMIIVGLFDEDQRMQDYAPWPMDLKNHKAQGDIYATRLMEKVMPYIKDTDATSIQVFLAGSFMGGLITVYTSLKYPGIFDCIGVFSLASWSNETEFINYVKNKNFDKNQKIYIQVGTQEAHELEGYDFGDMDMNQVYVDLSLNFYQMCRDKYMKHLELHVFEKETHSEKSWAKHLNLFLEFCLKDNNEGA